MDTGTELRFAVGECSLISSCHKSLEVPAIVRSTFATVTASTSNVTLLSQLDLATVTCAMVTTYVITDSPQITFCLTTSYNVFLSFWILTREVEPSQKITLPRNEICETKAI